MELILFPLRNLAVGASPATQADMINYAAAAGSGTFPVSSNHFWHGGLHFKTPTGGATGGFAVQAVARGRIVAYRLNDDWQTYEPVAGTVHKFSSSFVLIKHDLEHNYRPDPAFPNEKLFGKYRFYSLYMNLLPKAQLQAKARLPWFLCSNRVDPPALVGKRGAECLYQDSKNGMVQLKIGATSHWVPRNMVATRTVAGALKYFLTDPLGFSYNRDPSTFKPGIQTNAVVPCNIKVEAGDIIGYPGGVTVGTSFVDELLHFETFVNDADIAFADNTSTYTYAGNKSRAGKLACGEFSRDSSVPPPAPAPGAPAPPPTPPVWSRHYNINTKTTSAGSTHYLFTPPTTTLPGTTALKVYSDVDWKKGPTPWLFWRGSQFLKANGHVDHAKTQPTAVQAERMAVKQRTEWSSGDLPGRFAELQAGESGLPALAAAEFTKFVAHAKSQCFWEQVPGLPPATALWHLNPLYFVAQLRRCLLPFHHVEPAAFDRLAQRTFTEALNLLDERDKELVAMTPATQARFLQWFGYTAPSPPLVASTLVAMSHGAPTAIPHVATLTAAVAHVRGVIRKSKAAFQSSLRNKNLMRGFSVADYERTYAYVYGPDTAAKHIHLCYAFLKSMAPINNAVPLDWDGSVNTVLHECSHFADMGGLKDLSYTDAAGATVGPYGITHCVKMAQQFPSAALLNADNFSYFMTDGMHGTADRFTYLD
ncbi:M35 family metallo-endopeptidase [Lysobacter enzymogenes]|uniref:M35 family metallo-endopeptidase n=1 Tax=Lysobacter enzymogenes TaxID=69 RepID=UPI00099CC228|nr:M35 family metallo-endopeptidase [Lysobacter enzymogenes]UZW60197.1 M35 family metallo-endopeptidase [Lysobacter enzymogenes]